MPLLITRRSRSLPASGARVNPVLRTRLIWSMIAGLRVPTRIDGIDTDTQSSAKRSISCGRICSMQE